MECVLTLTIDTTTNSKLDVMTSIENAISELETVKQIVDIDLECYDAA